MAVDRAALGAAITNTDTHEALRSVVPGVFSAGVADIGAPVLLRDAVAGTAAPQTIGQWGWSGSP